VTDAEHRRFPRRDIELGVQISMVDGSTVRATLLDLAEGGVRLKVAQPEILPEQFLLKLDRRIERWSRIAWRSEEEIGVEFLKMPQEATETAAKRVVLITCPNTGRPIPTGIWLTAPGDLEKLSNARRLTQCPHCKIVHGWTPADGCLEAVASA
jgi:hypothetical protein